MLRFVEQLVCETQPRQWILRGSGMGVSEMWILGGSAMADSEMSE